MEKPIDRVVRALRTPIFALTVLSMPGFFLSYALLMKSALDYFGVTGFALLMVPHVIVWIGAACLLDYQQEHRTSQEHSR